MRKGIVSAAPTRLLAALLCGLALTGVACGRSFDQGFGQSSAIGLFTSLPVLWSEADGITAILHDEAPPHWSRQVLESRGRLIPLDTLLSLKRADRMRLLVMAQPRPLSPEENLALDRWVRAGGQLLLFADPHLTQESAYSIGDPRRPEALVLLSPILARWGLALHYDEDQPAGSSWAGLLGHSIPVDQAGSFAVTDLGNRCRVLGGGLAARCRIGRGRVLAVADAALLEAGQLQDHPLRATILEALFAELASGR